MSFLARALVDLPFLCAQTVTSELGQSLSRDHTHTVSSPPLLAEEAATSFDHSLLPLRLAEASRPSLKAFGVGGHPVLPVPPYLSGPLPY